MQYHLEETAAHMEDQELSTAGGGTGGSVRG